MEEIIQYVQNQMAQSSFRLRSYVQDEQGFKYPQRQKYDRIEKYLQDFLHSPDVPERWVIIPGLRGVGKTTILAQLYLNHYQSIKPQSMLYISLDDVVNVLGASLKEVLVAYERILGESFERLEHPVVLFIDEAQYDTKWASVLKSVYDRSKKVFIFCSGSSAIFLQTNPDVSRRAVFEKLYPASFCEFVMIKDNKYPVPKLKSSLREALFFSTSAAEAYKCLKDAEQPVLQYWTSVDRIYTDQYFKTGTLPFTIRMKDETRIFQAIQVLIDKVINYDVRNIGRFDAKTIANIKRMLFLLAESQDLSIQKIARRLDVSPNTIMHIFEVLETAEILIRVMPYGAHSKKVKKPSKYLFMSSAIRAAFLSVAGTEQMFHQQKGRFMEDIVALTLLRELISSRRAMLTFDNSAGGADFILTIAEKNIIPIEVGIGEKDANQVRKTMKKVKSAAYGIVISKNPLTLIENDNIIKVPLDYFLLI